MQDKQQTPSKRAWEGIRKTHSPPSWVRKELEPLQASPLEMQAVEWEKASATIPLVGQEIMDLQTEVWKIPRAYRETEQTLLAGKKRIRRWNNIWARVRAKKVCKKDTEREWKQHGCAIFICVVFFCFLFLCNPGMAFSLMSKRIITLSKIQVWACCYGNELALPRTTELGKLNGDPGCCHGNIGSDWLKGRTGIQAKSRWALVSGLQFLTPLDTY